MVVTVTVPNLATAQAGPLDGTYKGTFSGSASGDVEFSVMGSDVVVTKPGSGDGSISGSTIEMVVGNAVVSGYNCEYESDGQISAQPPGGAMANGNWNALCNGGITASGTWQATRSVASPSPTSTGQPRSLSLTARPKSLSDPGRTRLAATVSDCTGDTTIEFQVKKAGVFQTIASLAPQEACTVSIRRRVSKRTSFRAHSPAEEGFAAVDSRVVTVKVSD
jgi:hypothetical protein